MYSCFTNIENKFEKKEYISFFFFFISFYQSKKKKILVLYRNILCKNYNNKLYYF